MEESRRITQGWQRFGHSRLSRRRVVGAVVGGGVGLAAMSLVGCGGGEKSGGGGSEGSGLLTVPSDSSANAVRGGIWLHYGSSEPPHLDPNAGTGAATWSEAGHVYSRLLKYKVGTRQDGADGSVEPDAAQSYEQTADGLQITLKLRANMKFDARPPTNGRLLDSADVKFSYERFKALGGSRRDLFAELNPAAPLESIQTPDRQTVVMKLAFPYAPMLGSLAFARYVMIQPVEADGGFNARGEMRGTGPYMLTNYVPSSRFEYRRNPDYYDARNRPFFDGVDRPIVTEYANGVAQLRAGNIWDYSVRQTDILQTKRDVPDLVITQTHDFSRNGGPRIHLNQKSEQIFRDERVRRAISMLIDRQLYADTFLNLQPFKEAGIDVPVAFTSHIAPGEPQWIDPMGKEMGEGSRFFRHDPQAAQQLLGAAGLSKSKPLNLGWVMFTTQQYGTDWTSKNAAWQHMLQDSGFFGFSNNVVEYSQFIEQCAYARQEMPGDLCVTQTIPYPDVDGHLFAVYYPGGAFYRMPERDVQQEALIEQQRKELDRNKRSDIIKQFQRHAASKMYEIPIEAYSLTLNLSWPVLANYGVYSTWNGGNPQQEAELGYWMDKTKPPVGRS